MLTAQSDLSISQQSYDIKVAEWTSSLLANKEKVTISKSRLELVNELVQSGVSRFTSGLISSDQVSKDKEMYSLTADQLLLAERDLYNTCVISTPQLEKMYCHYSLCRCGILTDPRGADKLSQMTQ